MIKFHQFISEAWVTDKPVTTGVITGKELAKHVSKAHLKAIGAHRFHRIYATSYPHETKYRYRRDKWGFEKVDAAHAGVHTKENGTKVRHMVTFDLGQRGRINNAHVFRNENGERFAEKDGGNLMWHYSHSDKEQE